MARGGRRFAGRLPMPSGPLGKIGMYNLFTMQRMGSLPLFSAPLLTSLILAIGVGNPTYSRATIATVTDWEGIVRTVESGQARFTGSRLVKNLIAGSSEDLTNAGWSASLAGGTGVAPVVTPRFAFDPFGQTKTASRLQLDKGTGGAAGDLSAAVNTLRSTIPVGDTVADSVWLRTTDGSTQIATIRNSGTQTVLVDGTWRRFCVTETAAGILTQFQIITRGTYGTSQVLDLLVWGCQCEDTTGQTNLNCADYVSVGVLAAPFQGSGIDGVQSFPNSNGNTVNSSFRVVPGSGTPIPSATLLGYLPEETKTNLALFSEDFTNAAWIKTGVTVTPNTFLAPNGTVTADTLTATTPIATCLQAITITAANQVVSCWVRRRTGVGAIQLSADGIAFTPIAITGVFQRFQVTQNLGAGVVNAFFRIDVSGDEIDVWGAQYELGTVASSYVPTSAATVIRNADLLSYTSVGNVNLAGATVYCEARVPNYANPTDTNIRLVEVDDGTSINRFGLYVNPAGTFNMFVNSGGSAIDVATLGLVTINTTFKGAGSISAGKQVVDLNGAAPVLAVNNYPLALTTIRIGSFNSGTRQPNGNIRNVQIWGQQLPDLNLPPLTT